MSMESATSDTTTWDAAKTDAAFNLERKLTDTSDFELPLVGLSLEKNNTANKQRPFSLDEDDEANVIYPGSKEVASVMTAILLAIFLTSLDKTIIATAIPKITDEFHSLEDVGWYGSAFLLTQCAFQLLLGKVYTFYSPKYVFLVLITLFEIGSAICGAAPNSVTFIIGRAIAGIGSAGIMAGGIILMVTTVPLAKRPMYQGLFGAVFGVSSVAAPLIGGALTTNATWRWCFYINLPIGAVVIAIVVFILQPTPAQIPGVPFREKVRQLDLLGQLFLLPCCVCLLLALQWGGSTYAWSSPRIVALFVIYCMLLIGFVVVQMMFPETATIPASVMKSRSIIAAIWFIFFLASGLMLMVYYTSIWFQAIKGRTAVESGIDSIPLVLSLVLGSILAGVFVSKSGYYTPMAILSSILMPVGAGLISTWTPSTGHAQWIGYQILYGLALGAGMQQAGMTAQTVLPKKDVPTGVSLMFFWQTLGSAIFVSVGQNVMDTHLISGLPQVVKDVNPLKILRTGATDLRNVVPKKDLPAVLQVYNSAIRQTFYVAVILGALSALGAFALEWKSVKDRSGPRNGGSEAGTELKEKISNPINTESTIELDVEHEPLKQKQKTLEQRHEELEHEHAQLRRMYEQATSPTHSRRGSDTQSPPGNITSVTSPVAATQSFKTTAESVRSPTRTVTSPNPSIASPLQSNAHITSPPRSVLSPPRSIASLACSIPTIGHEEVSLPPGTRNLRSDNDDGVFF
ncbi:MFS-type efflux pump MFS1 [Acrodontium crateriforme]|uniref:MFS-type efflux pump MFS1 n=1 Tax=Acrodontium crateriforme TaxID=150365 RepID=A0AAQ3R878_9PEZI|nr:MFS-type efflux pump MFS1 [Acrodontium crateriforme]